MLISIGCHIVLLIVMSFFTFLFRVLSQGFERIRMMKMFVTTLVFEYVCGIVAGVTLFNLAHLFYIYGSH